MNSKYPAAIRHLNVLSSCQGRTVSEVHRRACAEAGEDIGMTSIHAIVMRLARQGCIKSTHEGRAARWHLTGWGRQVLATAAQVCQAALKDEGVTR